MKRFGIILFITGLFCQQGLWQSGTAYTLPEGRWEVGLFQPARWGQGQAREISFYKLSSLFIPNISIKQKWSERDSFVLSTNHTLLYPTPLLKKLQSPLGMDIGEPNMFALISPEFDIPPMIIISNMFLVSIPLGSDRILTSKIGMSIALGGSNLAEESTIDLPLVYHRLAVLYNGWSVRFGLDMNGSIKKSISYLIDGDILLIPGMKGDMAIEHKGMLAWKRSHRFQVSLGYKLVYGVYPDGYPNENITRTHLLPLIDFQWARD